MSLQRPLSGITWSDYKIDTPTFKLTPIEKPDMSPFLFHMTGKGELHSILVGDGGKNPCSNHGFIKASVPKSTTGNFNAEVVCVTESPIFALDFFRYRSYRRWLSDQVFGIGFDKSELSEIGVRPCLYADESLINNIIYIKENIDKYEAINSDVGDHFVSLINSLYPLVMPLLENTALQGFMWEREWRYSNHEKKGLIFPHRAIRIICCPKDEEAGIRGIFSDNCDKIQFVRSWQEYNEVTAYLNSRKENAYIPKREVYDSEADFKNALEEQKDNYQKIYNHMVAYQDFIETIGSKEKSASEGMEELNQIMKSLDRDIDKLKNKL